MLFKFFFLFFLLFFCTNLFAKDGSAIALMYHRFDENKYPSTSISQKNFHSQLLYLKENNFNVLPITSLIDFFYHNKPLPEKSVFITVDDAYTSFYKFAFPVLKKFNFPFSIFLSTDFISKDGKNDFMNLSGPRFGQLNKFQKSITGAIVDCVLVVKNCTSWKNSIREERVC